MSKRKSNNNDKNDVIKKEDQDSTYRHPDFVDMQNTKGVIVEIHKDRVEELKKAGYKLCE